MCKVCAQFNPFAGDWLHAAAQSETGDAPDNATTSLVMGPGQTLTGTLTADDTDWIRLTVDPGSQFTITVEDAGGISDSVLTLFDDQGREIAFDDDSGTGFLSAITHTATEASYFVAVSTYQTHYGFTSVDTGAYRLSLTQSGDGGSSDKPLFSNDAIADQLINGYWEFSGRDPRNFDIRADEGGSITVDYSGLSAPGQWFAERALDVWSSVSGLAFVSVSSGAQIRFDDEESGAHATSTIAPDGMTESVAINISTGWISGDHYQYDGYSLQTFIHEIGHALGLGHAGNYNAGDEAIDYAQHASFANDSWQASVMSYFSQAENPEVDGSRAYLLTPMIADLVAVRALYGAAGDLRATDTVYGIGSTAGDFYDTLEETWTTMAFTIVDDGGRDLLDFSGTDAHQTISLKEESYSSVGGLQGNMGIARGTRIEDVRSGSGDDKIDGNASGNRVEAGGGADRIEGARGADTLFGEAGNDTLDGGRSGDVLMGGDGHDMLHGMEGHDRLEGDDGNDTLSGGDKRDILKGGAGNDSLDGGKGRDKLMGGAGDDRLDGREGDDRLWGRDGKDTIQGAEGADQLWGGDAADRLGGGSGNDELSGQLGADRLWGDDGADTLIGGKDDDTLTGGNGADVFVFAPGGGADRITDWTSGADRLDLTDLDFVSAAEVLALARETTDGVVIDLDPGSSVLLENAVLDDLAGTQFLL